MKKPILINQKLLSETTEKAKQTDRKRINYNFHTDYSDPMNRMLNALEPGTYCRPHKHEDPDKREVFLVLKGTMAVIFFHPNGEISEIVKLCPAEGSYGVEVPPGVWHTLVSLESGSVAYEVKDGPYIQMNDKNFALWAPEEGSKEAPSYLQTLIDAID